MKNHYTAIHQEGNFYDHPGRIMAFILPIMNVVTDFINKSRLQYNLNNETWTSIKHKNAPKADRLCTP